MTKSYTMAQAVRDVIDGIPNGSQFHGYDLKNWVVRRLGRAEKCYVDTVLRVARKVRRSSFKSVCMKESLYEKVG